MPPLALKRVILYGRQTLKKYSTQKKIQKAFLYAALSLGILSALFFASCKTLSVPETDIDPFTLFDEGAGLYLRIPVKGNEGFLQNLVRAWTDEVADSAAPLRCMRHSLLNRVRAWLTKCLFKSFCAEAIPCFFLTPH